MTARANIFNVIVVAAFAVVAVVLVRFTLPSPVILAGLGYAVAFIWFAWTYPTVALTLVFIAAPFQADLSGEGAVRFSIAELHLALTAAVFVIRCVVERRFQGLGPMTIPIILYFAVGLLGSMLNTFAGRQEKEVFVSLAQMILYLVVTVLLFCTLPRRDEDLLVPLRWSIVVGALLACLAMGGGAGLLSLNKNGVGASLSAALVINIELWLAAQNARARMWLLIAMMPIGAGLVFMLSRGGWIAAILGVVFLCFYRRRTLLLFKIGIPLIPVVFCVFQFLPQDAREYAVGFQDNRMNIKKRYESIALAKELFYSSPIYGRGLCMRKDYDATNLLLLTLAESGILGAITLAVVFGSVFGMVRRAVRSVPVTDPRFSLAALGGALTAGKLAHGMVDHYWGRGPLLMTWAAVGMALRIYFQARVPQPHTPSPESADDTEEYETMLLGTGGHETVSGH